MGTFDSTDTEKASEAGNSSSFSTSLERQGTFQSDNEGGEPAPLQSGNGGAIYLKPSLLPHLYLHCPLLECQRSDFITY